VDRGGDQGQFMTSTLINNYKICILTDFSQSRYTR